MKYGSVCSGIEAASVAWHPLGWEPQWFSEIESFPSEVLKQRFPDIPNLGDMTKLTLNPTFNEKSIDLLVGGTPCQSFSVAGLRGGLADPRGNLMLTFLGLAEAKKPKWIVWENVPGVLSSNGGKDFGTFLGALAELGYGFAYRVLDAQHFGVAQRRRRVFVVGYLGDWRVAGAVLFESESLQGNTKPSRKKRQETPTDAQGSVGEAGSWWDGSQVAGTLTKQNANGAQRMPDKDNFGAILQPTIIDRVAQPIGINGNIAGTIDANYFKGCGSANFGERDVVAQPIAYSFDALSSNSMKSSNPNSGCRAVDVAKTLDTATPEPSKNQGGIAIAQPIAIQDIRPIKKAQNGRGWNDDGTSYTVDTKATQGVAQPIAFKVRGGCEGGGKGYLGQEEQAFTISATQDQQIAQPLYYESHPNDSRVNGPKDVADTVSARYGTGGGNTPLVQQPIAVDTYNYTTNDHTTQTIRSQSDTEHIGAVLQPIAVDCFNQTINDKTSQTIGSSASDVNHVGAVIEPTITIGNMAIRRLTPKECERLQGFPDDWTRIPYRKKPADQCPDGARYKACGNSMAVPVMRWIGERIEKIEKMLV